MLGKSNGRDLGDFVENVGSFVEEFFVFVERVGEFVEFIIRVGFLISKDSVGLDDGDIVGTK